MSDLGELVSRKVVRRNGDIVEFDPAKIRHAIKAAGDATNQFEDDELDRLTARVVDVVNHKYTADQAIFLEKIQDIIENVLLQSSYYDTAKQYVIYRDKRAQARESNKVLVDVEKSITEYLNQLDWRVNENANQGYSLGGMILNISGKIVANYWLSYIYPKEIGEAHRSGDIHLHDLSMLSGYCAGWSLRQLLEEGFNGVPGHVESVPPKHLSAAVGQMVNFMGTLQNEWAGAQAFSSVDTYLAPYIRLDGMSYREVKQKMQELIYNLNVPSRWGTQTPFTNFTFDITCPADLKSQHPKIGGREVDFTYGDLQSEMDMINRTYIEVMAAGDAKGRPFTFPIPTYNVTKDFQWEGELADLLFEMTAKYGLPYFQNFVTSDLNPTDVRSMCCRLRLDVRELLKRGNGLFGSAEQTGSIGVVTVNCARLGYSYKGNIEGLYYRLDHLMNLAKNSLEIKRKTIQKLMDGGLYPFTKRYLGSFKNHFSTIGINGVNEMIRNFTGDAHDISDQYGQKMALDLLEHIRAKMKEFQEETGHMYNLEASPAEGTTYRFAKEDQKVYPDIIQAGTKEAPYYTNSTQVAVGYSDDPFEVLELQDELQAKYTGGTVLHLYMAERISDSRVCRNIIRRIFENYRIPYLTITPTFSVCPKHGYIAGEHEYCPICDEELEHGLSLGAGKLQAA
ncbi:MAG: ribonucleoside triphosphate reductase [Rickettsiales bacterium]|jgi:ribonucleoside-triphosphate reductase|nr:ribonucleoside triphosphate reductase [Rickettsiales bacterium]